MLVNTKIETTKYLNEGNFEVAIILTGVSVAQNLRIHNGILSAPNGSLSSSVRPTPLCYLVNMSSCRLMLNSSNVSVPTKISYCIV